jgi:hypothetical protein
VIEFRNGLSTPVRMAVRTWRYHRIFLELLEERITVVETAISAAAYRVPL